MKTRVSPSLSNTKGSAQYLSAGGDTTCQGLGSSWGRMSARRCRRPRNHWRRNTARRSRAGDPPGDPGDVPDRVRIRRRRPPQTRPLIRRLQLRAPPSGREVLEAPKREASALPVDGIAGALQRNGVGRRQRPIDHPAVPRDFRRRPRARWWRRTLRRTAPRTAGLPPVPDRVAEVEGPHTVPGDERNLSGGQPRPEADEDVERVRVRVRSSQARHALERGRDVNRLERVGGTREHPAVECLVRREEDRRTLVTDAIRDDSQREVQVVVRTDRSQHPCSPGGRSHPIQHDSDAQHRSSEGSSQPAAQQALQSPHPQSAGSADPSGRSPTSIDHTSGSTGGPRAGRRDHGTAPRMELLVQLLEALDGAVEVQVLAATLPAPGRPSHWRHADPAAQR